LGVAACEERTGKRREVGPKNEITLCVLIMAIDFTIKEIKG
jgi:hypothetical protein